VQFIAKVRLLTQQKKDFSRRGTDADISQFEWPCTAYADGRVADMKKTHGGPPRHYLQSYNYKIK
jgi:hypothetical protein